MADTPLTPMTDGDVTPATSGTPVPAAPLQTGSDEGGTLSGGAFDGAQGNEDGSAGAQAGGGGQDGKLAGAKQTLRDGTAKLRGEAGDKALRLAEDGKARATGALDQLYQALNDAAAQVDEKLGEQYGQYARSAAERVQGFSSQINDKSVDELIEDARTLVRKSPAVAIGAAATVGFVVARLLTAGLDQRERDA